MKEIEGRDNVVEVFFGSDEDGWIRHESISGTTRVLVINEDRDGLDSLKGGTCASKIMLRLELS